MSNSLRGGWRSITAIGVAVAAMLGAASPAGAHSLTARIAAPPTAVVEDTTFAVGFAGDMTALPDGEGYIAARIRSGTQIPCAATDAADPGDRLFIGAGRLVGAF